MLSLGPEGRFQGYEELFYAQHNIKEIFHFYKKRVHHYLQKKKQNYNITTKIPFKLIDTKTQGSPEPALD